MTNIFVKIGRRIAQAPSESAHSPTFASIARFSARAPFVVIAIWIAVAGLVNVAWPQLEDVIKSQSPPTFPADMNSLQTFATMSEKFEEDGTENSLIIGYTSEAGFDKPTAVKYQEILGALRDRPEVTLEVSDLMSDERTRTQVMSEDGKAWFSTVNVAGELGSPAALENVLEIQKIVHEESARTGLTAIVTGPPATIADGFTTSQNDLKKITIATIIGIGVILMIVYRSPITAMLPLITVGVSVAVARGVLAGLGELGLSVTQPGEALMMVVIAGAGVDYSVFLISRYHEYIQQGRNPREALILGSSAIGRVIFASALTVAVASVAMMLAKIGILASIGPAVAIAVLAGFAASMTVMPALLALAAKRKFGFPKKDRTKRYWASIGVLVARKPWQMLGASMIVMGILAGSASFMTFTYDDRSAQPDSTESNRGYALLEEHFPISMLSPQYLIIESDHDLRTPEGLADLDQVASRVSQIEGIDAVRGITRPLGEKLNETTLAWQIGQMADQIDEAGESTEHYTDQFAKIKRAAVLGERLMQLVDVNQITTLLKTALATLAQVRSAIAQFQKFEPLLDQAEQAAALADQFASIAPDLEQAAGILSKITGLIAPVQQFLTTNPTCTANPQCTELGSQLTTLTRVQNAVSVDQIKSLQTQLTSATGGQSLSSTLAQVRGMVSSFESNLGMLDQLEAMAGNSKEITAIVTELQGMGLVDPKADLSDQVGKQIDEAEQLFGSLAEASRLLRQISTEASTPSASGFYLPAAAFENPDFAAAAGLFISPDGTTARYLVQSAVDPYSSAAMAQAREVTAVATAALPNTSLEGAKIGLAGFPSINGDLQQYFTRDFKVIVLFTLAIVFVILAIILRALVAPFYLLLTVLLNYAAALGAGVILFQGILDEPMYWAVPAMAFILLVAVGADYNLLLISRLREETKTNMRVGVIRTVAATGSVITSAGMIFAVSMFGLMAGSISTMLQMGFVIGVGLLLDTFVVRSMTVPAIATIVGPLSWWPTHPKAKH